MEYGLTRGLRVYHLQPPVKGQRGVGIFWLMAGRNLLLYSSNIFQHSVDDFNFNRKPVGSFEFTRPDCSGPAMWGSKQT